MDASKIFGKAWRLVKVIYILITVPIVVLLIGETTDSLDFRIDEGYFFDGYLAVIAFLGIILGYIIFTDTLRRILSYIDEGNFRGFLPYKKVGVKKILLMILGGIIFTGFMIFGSETKRNYCSDDFESVDSSEVCRCEFGYKREKNICIEDVKLYHSNGISFTYPSYLNVTEKPFEVFQFFNSENIHVKKYNLQTLVKSCVDSLAERRSDGDKNKEEQLKKDLFAEYKDAILKIQKGEEIYPNDYLDYISCGSTAGPINMNSVKTIDGTSGKIINYYFTQVDGGCLTQFNTELLLVKNEEEIYSILFKNNFGEFERYMLSYRDKKNGSEACIVDYELRSGFPYTGIAEESAINIPLYYKRGVSLHGEPYSGLEENDKIIQEIISTVKLD